MTCLSAAGALLALASRTFAGPVVSPVPSAGYTHIARPHPTAGWAFTTDVRPLGNGVVSLTLPKAALDSFWAVRDPQIRLRFEGPVPKALAKAGRREFVMISGLGSNAILPATPKPGDTAVIIPAASEFAKFPAKTERLTTGTLRRLDAALARLENDVTFANIQAAERVLTRHFDGASGLLLQLSNFDLDRVKLTELHGSGVAALDWERSAGVKDAEVFVGLEDSRRLPSLGAVDLTLTNPRVRANGRRAPSVEVFTRFWVEGLYRDHGGWYDSSYSLTRGLASRSPQLRRSAAVLGEMIANARRARRTRAGAEELDSVQAELNRISRAR